MKIFFSVAVICSIVLAGCPPRQTENNEELQNKLRVLERRVSHLESDTTELLQDAGLRGAR